MLIRMPETVNAIPHIFVSASKLFREECGFCRVFDGLICS